MKILISLFLLMTSHAVFSSDTEGSGSITESTTVNENIVYKQVCVQANTENAETYCTIVAVNTVTDS